MLFITNRQIKESNKSRKNRKIHFDYRENAPSNHVFYCEREGKDNYTEIGSDELLKRLKEMPFKQILLYIHGFSNFPEDDIFPTAFDLQKLFDEKEKGLIYVVPMIWPCDYDSEKDERSIIKEYWSDQRSADMSSYSFTRIMERFLIWSNEQQASETPCKKRINILAHSMGNRVLRKTLEEWAKYDSSKGIPQIFKNIFMVAADVVNETLSKGESGRFICESAKNVTVYYASDDLALRASKVINLKNGIASRRLGHTGPEDYSKLPNNVYSVDCDEHNFECDILKGHSYFTHNKHGKAGEVFKHLSESIITGRVKISDKEKRHLIL